MDAATFLLHPGATKMLFRVDYLNTYSDLASKIQREETELHLTKSRHYCALCHKTGMKINYCIPKPQLPINFLS